MATKKTKQTTPTQDAITNGALIGAHNMLGPLVGRDLPTRPGYAIGRNAERVGREIRALVAKHQEIAQAHGIKDDKGKLVVLPSGLQQLDAEGEAKWQELLSMEIPWQAGRDYWHVYIDDLEGERLPPAVFGALSWMFAERKA